jgi:integrase
MAVPQRHRAKVGKSSIKCSLQTADITEARKLAAIKRAELIADWEEMRVRRIPSKAELEAIAVEIGYELYCDLEDARRSLLAGNSDKRAYERLKRRAKINLEEAGRLRVTGEHDVVRGFADIAIEEAGFDIERDSDLYAYLCDRLNDTRFAAAERSYRQMNGEVDAETDSKLVVRVQQRNAEKAKPGETIIELYDAWTAEQVAKGKKRPDTVRHDRVTILHFAEFVGVDRAVDTITAHEVYEFRDALRNVPPKWTANKHLKGLKLREAAMKARSLDLAMTSFTTVNNKLSAISPLYGWLAENPRWLSIKNPCAGLFHKDVKGKNRRPSFSTEDFNKILSSPLYTGFLADGSEHKPGNMHADDWRKWLPVLAMFTGARIGELAQLRVGDVRQEKGEWFVHIREDEKAGLKTKSRKSRPAPIHSMLVEFGFIDFVEQRREEVSGDPAAQLFTGFASNKRDQIGAVPSRWFRSYLRKIGVKSGADGFGAHSFRHSLSDRLRSEGELLDDDVAVFLGHSQKTTTGGYGALPQMTVTMYTERIERVTFEGVDFSHLRQANKRTTH